VEEQLKRLRVSQIKAGRRHRKDFGDLKSLAQSIKEEGLLQPVGVTADMKLVFGERRLRAVRDVLKRKTIIARIVDVSSIVAGEWTENEVRKDFSPSERVAIAKAIEKAMPERRGKSQKFDGLKGRSDDIAAKRSGFGNRQTYRQAQKVIANGSSNLILAMDQGRVSISAAALLADAGADEQNAVLELDEKAILQAAREVRKRQVERELESQRPKRRKRSKHSKGDAKKVTCGDAFDLIPRLKNDSINLVVTSPPYCEQRKDYKGVSEAEYPEWTTEWMGLLWDKLADDGSVFIVIRPHIKRGALSDYVLRTRLALRDDGWTECEELIWLKPDAPPLGSRQRPRRTWEHILWFSKTPKPYVNLKACGRETDRIGFAGSIRFGVGGDSPIGHGQTRSMTNGVARTPDVFTATIGSNGIGIDHPAVFPVALAEQLILTFSQERDRVLDPFCGSGSSLAAAKGLLRDFRGFDVSKKYVEIALSRLAES
jgi:DNA modification methylase